MRKTNPISIIFLFLTLIHIFGCSSDCNDDSDTAMLFPAKFKLVASNGENQLMNTDFDVSLLKLIDSDFPNRTTIYSILNINDEPIIEFRDALTISNIIFEYNGGNKFELELSDRQISTNNCVTEIVAFKATSGGELICECDINAVVPIEFNI